MKTIYLQQNGIDVNKLKHAIKHKLNTKYFYFDNNSISFINADIKKRLIKDIQNAFKELGYKLTDYKSFTNTYTITPYDIELAGIPTDDILHDYRMMLKDFGKKDEDVIRYQKELQRRKALP